MSENTFQQDDQIEWGYWHHLNRISKVWRVKTGRLIRINKQGKALVKFNGNKTCCLKPLSEIKHKQPNT